MERVYQVKVVGLRFNHLQSDVKAGEQVVLKADIGNKFDKDAIAVYNSDYEMIGHVANSERTLSLNNRKNGNISASELKGEIDFSDKEFCAEVMRAYSSCLYLEVHENKFNYLNSEEVSFPEIGEVAALKSEIGNLKVLVSSLKEELDSLKVLVTVGGEDKSSPITSNGRKLISFVGLSHYEGQDHLGYDLSIVEEPIFPNAKGTSLFLKSGEYRIGVAPSKKKKQYCLDHNIPYCDSKNLKNQSFDGNVIIEEIVYGEYAVVSV